MPLMMLPTQTRTQDLDHVDGPAAGRGGHAPDGSAARRGPREADLRPETGFVSLTRSMAVAGQAVSGSHRQHAPR